MATDEQREQLDELWQTWRDAEKATQVESAKYVGMWWEGEEPKRPEKMFDHEAIETLDRLRSAAKAAQDAYFDFAQRSRG